MYICTAHTCGCPLRPEESIAPLELELQSQWVLGPELGFSAEALSTCALVLGHTLFLAMLNLILTYS